MPGGEISMGGWAWTHAVSPDESFALLAGEGKIVLATISPEKKSSTLAPIKGTEVPVKGWVWSAAISNDGKFAVFASDDDTLIRIAGIVRDTKGNIVGLNSRDDAAVKSSAVTYSCVITPDDQFVVFGTGGQDKRIHVARVLRKEGGYALEELTGASVATDGEVYTSILAEDALLMFGTSSYKVHAVELVREGANLTLKPRPELDAELVGQPYAIDFSREHKLLIVGTDSGKLEVFEVEEKNGVKARTARREELEIPLDASTFAIDLSSDGEMLLLGHSDGTVRLFRAVYTAGGRLSRFERIPKSDFDLGIRVVEVKIMNDKRHALVTTSNNAPSYLLDLTAPSPKKMTHINPKFIAQTLEHDLPNVKKAPTLAEYRKEQEKLFALEEVSQVLAVEADLKSILTDIATKVGKAMGANKVNFWLPTQDKKGLYITAAYGMDEAYMEQTKLAPIPIGTAFIGRAVKTGRPWGSGNCLISPRTFPPLMKGVVRNNIHGLLCLPLKSQGDVFGGICIYYDDVHEFSQFELRLTTIVANQAATAIRNVRTFQDLEAERTKTMSIVYSLTDGLVMYDLEGRVTLFNPRAQELLLVEFDKVVGRKIDEKMAAQSTSLKNLYNLANSASDDYKTAEYSTEGHQELTLEVTRIPVHAEGGVKIGSMQILHDITREKVVEKMKVGFVSVASHQLRTPLTGMRWSLDLLRDEGMSAMNERQRKIVDDLFTINNTLISVVDDLLDVSRIEEGEFGYTFSRADVTPIIQKIIKALEVNAQMRNVAISLDAKESIPVSIDPDKLELVFQNIIGNGIKYTKRDGYVKVFMKHEPSKLTLAFEDNGIGIPEKDKPFIFTKFFRAENAIQYQTEGSGLGLYIVKSIADKHHASIRFESEEGKGTTFYLEFPLDPAQAPRGERTEKSD